MTAELKKVEIWRTNNNRHCTKHLTFLLKKANLATEQTQKILDSLTEIYKNDGGRLLTADVRQNKQNVRNI